MGGMNSYKFLGWALAAALCAPVGAVAAGAGGGLSLQQLEDMALRRDPLIGKFQDEAQAFAAQAEAAAQQPDPKLKLGLLNVPVDSFDLAQEGMTQEAIGVQQYFPPADLLRGMGERVSRMGQARDAQAQNRRLETLRELRKAWLKVYQAYHALGIIRQGQQLFKDMLEVTRYQYRAGQGNQQDVIRAELELNMLQDKELELDSTLQVAQAQLRRWAGDEVAVEDLLLENLSLPTLPELTGLKGNVSQHPLFLVKDMLATSAQAGIEVARAKYDIGWMLDVTYGFRQPDTAGLTRSDMLSAMILVDLPFFTAKRQDRLLAASEKEYSAARDEVEDTRLALLAMVDSEYARMEKLRLRLAFYRDTVLPQSSQNAEAALKAYKSRAGEFTPLIRARLTELTNKLTALQLLVEHAQAQAELLYLAGDRKS